MQRYINERRDSLRVDGLLNQEVIEQNNHVGFGYLCDLLETLLSPFGRLRHQRFNPGRKFAITIQPNVNRIRAVRPESE